MFSDNKVMSTSLEGVVEVIESLSGGHLSSLDLKPELKRQKRGKREKKKRKNLNSKPMAHVFRWRLISQRTGLWLEFVFGGQNINKYFGSPFLLLFCVLSLSSQMGFEFLK